MHNHRKPSWHLTLLYSQKLSFSLYPRSSLHSLNDNGFAFDVHILSFPVTYSGIDCWSHHGGAKNHDSWELGLSIIGRPIIPPSTSNPPSGLVAQGLGR